MDVLTKINAIRRAERAGEDSGGFES